MSEQQTPAAADSQVEELILNVGAPAHGGHCVSRLKDDPTGPVVFVRHALPGETVCARLTERGARSWRAETTEVLVASPDRVRPAWAQAGAGGVGGGELSHVALPAQRTWKRWVLADCLRRIGGQKVVDAVAALPEAKGGSIAVEAMPSEQAAEASDSSQVRAHAGTATRTRVGLAATADGQLGMHGFRSGEVLPLHSLPLAVREIQELGLTERAVWRRGLTPGDTLRAVAPSAGEPLVLVGQQVMNAQGRPTTRRRVEEVVDASGLGLGQLRYSLHADSFWQVHRDAPTVLVDRVVRAALSPEPTAAGSTSQTEALQEDTGLKVLELYSGAGLFTLPLTLLTGEVRSIEGAQTAVRDARRLLHSHTGAHLFAGRVSARSVAGVGEAFGNGQQRADVVVLDPPRAGAGREAVAAVCALEPQRVVMVACDPASLARDLGTFLCGAYRLVAMSALDMFPHTHHFETIAVLERA
ncbi:class I SAM-dependent RNA methyltransferase [Actinomyces trachealis]|uniref:class I SAM-dependent RNA methyltransferase n=1 Tax=Actinomyces trachealis TaxID=2763540 RepID=UPI001FD13F0F|nr:class I SAM-dependent RNA methyltransferase [Actinomyces trachealis]